MFVCALQVFLSCASPITIVCVCCSDNETIMKEYRDREMSECHMEIYQVCQEGHQLVKKLELEFDEG